MCTMILSTAIETTATQRQITTNITCWLLRYGTLNYRSIYKFNITLIADNRAKACLAKLNPATSSGHHCKFIVNNNRIIVRQLVTLGFKFCQNLLKFVGLFWALVYIDTVFFKKNRRQQQLTSWFENTTVFIAIIIQWV